MARIIHYVVLAVLLILHVCGCGDEGGPGFGNQPPTVWLSSAPPEGSVAAYTIHLYWGGWDPDGEVAFYEYVITNNETGVFDPADTTSTPGDSKWSRVYAHDSTFVFSADQIPDSSAIDFDGVHSPEEFRRSHTFFIRAVDEQGLRSVKPAYRSFTSRTLSPTVFVNIPSRSRLNAAEVPPITTFRWTATDYVNNIAEVQEPDSVRHILVPLSKFPTAVDRWGAALDYIRKNPTAEEWSEWKWYKAPQDSGKFWTSRALDFGQYYFAVQAKDEAGAVSPVFDLDWNLRRILVGPRSSGPILTVCNEYIGCQRTASPNTPPSIIDLPAGVPMSFEFWGDAEDYGGLVSGYRYGWDILDLNDDEQWEIDFTPFVGDVARSPGRTFFFGTHSFFIEVIDNSGFKSRVEVRVNIVPFTMENDLLLVDDWLEGFECFQTTGGNSPCDAEHDEFWRYVLDSVEGFNPNVDVFELNIAGRNELPIQVMARYKNLIWKATGNPSGEAGAFLNRMITFPDPEGTQSGGRTSPNLIALYMSAGGHVLLVGNQIMTMVINPSVIGRLVLFPLIFRYELTGDQDGTYTSPNEVGEFGVGESSFAYRECCLNVLDLTYLQNMNQIRRQTSTGTQRCPVNLIRDNSRVRDGMRGALPIDVVTGGGFPALELRPEVSGPGLFYANSGLVVDIYNPDYFSTMTPCGGVAETIPPRDCFEPIYGNACNNTSSLLYNAPVAFWTSQFEESIADAPGAVEARSAVWGFHPVYFKPDQVKEAIGIIVHDEWQLERR
jgi:hypothetical protein